MKLYILCWTAVTTRITKSDYCFIQAVDDIAAQTQMITIQTNMPESTNFKLFSVGNEI